MAPNERRELSAKPLEMPEIISFPVEVDISNCAPLAAALTAAIRPAAPVVIADLSRTKFCDGAGIRCLLAAHDQAVACGVELRAVIRSSAVWRLLVLLGADQKLRVYPEMQAGLTGAPGVARRPGPDDPAGTAADVSERYQDALRAACHMADRVGRLLRQPRPASASDRPGKWEFARWLAQVSAMPVIEQAKGIVMFCEHCTADEAFDMLRRASQRSSVPVREIAAVIVEHTSR